MHTISPEKIQRELRKHKIAKLFKTATKYGIIEPGWSFIDYSRHAANVGGWNSTCVSGPKGTAKSNLTLQHGLALYQDVTKTKKHNVTDKKQFINLLEYAAKNELRMPWLNIDDAAAMFPKSLYTTNRRIYTEMQKNWELVRPVISNFEYSCVIKQKLAPFLLQDITGDIKCYKPVYAGTQLIMSHYSYVRWMWLRDLKHPELDVAKPITVEEIPFPIIPQAFKYDETLNKRTYISGGQTYQGYEFFEKRACLLGFSISDFDDYWKLRIKMTQTGMEGFIAAFDDAPTEKEEQTTKNSKKDKLTKEERAAINRTNGAKGLETQKRLRNKN